MITFTYLNCIHQYAEPFLCVHSLLTTKCHTPISAVEVSKCHIWLIPHTLILHITGVIRWCPRVPYPRPAVPCWSTLVISPPYLSIAQCPREHKGAALWVISGEVGVHQVPIMGVYSALQGLGGPQQEQAQGGSGVSQGGDHDNRCRQQVL